MTSKVRIKAGSIEFEYEGQTELSMDHIKELFSHIEGMLGTVVTEAPAALVPAGANSQAAKSTTPGTITLHVNSIAEKIGAKSGSELALAAAAWLQLADGKETFSRQELLSTMKKATKFYKDGMSGNLSKILNTLLGSKFNQNSGGNYCLSHQAHQELEAKLA